MFGRPRVRRRHRVVNVDFALPAMIEEAKRGVASLLDFGQHKSRPDGVNGPGRDEDDIVLASRTPLDQVVIEPSSIEARSCGGVSLCFSPTATLASGVADRTYQASVLPFTRPIECANASSG